jgi:hypothetical protein
MRALMSAMPLAVKSFFLPEDGADAQHYEKGKNQRQNVRNFNQRSFF